MNKTTYVTSIMGLIAGIAGIEHGIGEILQGNVNAPDIVFNSWPNTKMFASMAGEPAMSLISNMLISGILSVLIAAIVIFWSLTQRNHKYYGVGFLILSVGLLLVGGGFGPPLLGIILGCVVLYSRKPGREMKREEANHFKSLIASLWKTFFFLNLCIWLFLFPVFPFISWLFNFQNDMLIAITAPTAFFSLVLALISAASWDQIRLIK